MGGVGVVVVGGVGLFYKNNFSPLGGVNQTGKEKKIGLDIRQGRFILLL